MRKTLSDCKQCFQLALMVGRVLIELAKLARDMIPKEADPIIYQDIDHRPRVNQVTEAAQSATPQ